MLATDNINVPSLSNNSYCNCNNTTVLHFFRFRHSSLIITLYCAYEVDSRCFRPLFYRPTQRSASNFSSISFRCSHSQEDCHPQKMYSHGTSRPKPPPLLTRFPFITTFPQLVCLFKNLVYQVAVNLGSWPMTSNSLFKIFG